ncbi:hypothetical protein Tco_1581077, partial [Tanacetum coccineum]
MLKGYGMSLMRPKGLLILILETLSCAKRRRLTTDTANHMVRDVTDKEIREAIFSMGDNKAPGPDGYSA